MSVVIVVVCLSVLECRECPELVPWCGACPLELTRVVSESERVALRVGIVSLRESRNSGLSSVGSTHYKCHLETPVDLPVPKVTTRPSQ